MSVLIKGQALTFDYKKKGDDWPLLKYPNNNCGGTGQAPIDLSYKMPAVSIAEDELQKLYTNQRDDIHVAWNGFCSVVAMDKKGQDL